MVVQITIMEVVVAVVVVAVTVIVVMAMAVELLVIVAKVVVVMMVVLGFLLNSMFPEEFRLTLTIKTVNVAKTKPIPALRNHRNKLI